MRKGTQKDYELLFTIFSNFTHLVLKVFNFDLKLYQSKWKAINDIYKNFVQIFSIFKKKKEKKNSYTAWIDLIMDKVKLPSQQSASVGKGGWQLFLPQ